MPRTALTCFTVQPKPDCIDCTRNGEVGILHPKATHLVQCKVQRSLRCGDDDSDDNDDNVILVGSLLLLVVVLVLWIIVVV